MTRGRHRSPILDPGDVGLKFNDLPKWEGCALDPSSLFAGTSNRMEIEVGSGKGTFLVQQAHLQPNTFFLGIEWAGEFFRHAADRVRRHQLKNVKLLHDDASEFIKHRCSASTVDAVHCYFTDPWPKKRHHKRRFLQDSTLHALYRVLREGGRIHLVTDHVALWEWYESQSEKHASLFAREPFQSPDSAQEGEVIGTNFERKYRVAGRPFHAMSLRRKQGEGPDVP